MTKVQVRSLCVIVGSLSLAACGGGEEGANTTAAAANIQAPKYAPLSIGGGTPKFSLADGPDICFRQVAAKLGANAKVSELTSFFSVGKEIDPSAITSAPAGGMTTCTVQYQNPQDPRKLLEMSMDTKDGTFSAPRPVEITVMGGDASKFNLEDHLISLSQVNAAGLKAVMDGQKASMDKIFGKYAWSGVRLSSPGAFDPKHWLRLDIDGRLASNDIKESGYASIALDGKTINRNYLKP